MRSRVLPASHTTMRSDAMTMLTVRKLPDEIQRALQVLAVRHGRGAEAEVRAILAVAVMPDTPVRIGDALAALSRKIGLSNEDFEVL